MATWFKENWFKFGILLSILILAGGTAIYLNDKNNLAEQELLDKIKKGAIAQEQENTVLAEKKQLEAEKAAKEALEKRRNETWDALVNQCITDAYVELKTLQGNFDWIYFNSCSKSSYATGCDAEWIEEAKADAFKTYNEEWVPQCKLGNRVFIDYEAYR